MINAKWTSVVDHIHNKHKKLDNDLFKECEHDHLEQREWIKAGGQMLMASIYITLNFAELKKNIWFAL